MAVLTVPEQPEGGPGERDHGRGESCQGSSVGSCRAERYWGGQGRADLIVGGTLLVVTTALSIIRFSDALVLLPLVIGCLLLVRTGTKLGRRP